MVFGNCVPSLVVENKSSETIDYLQVDLVVALSDGQAAHRRVDVGLPGRRALSYRARREGDLEAASRYIAGAGRRLRAT